MVITESRIGVALALAISIFLGSVWEWKENVGYNFTALTSQWAVAMPSIDLSLEEQAARLQRITGRIEQGGYNWITAKLAGDDFYRASFGVNATRVVELTVPTPSSDGRGLAVLCSCPHNATLASPLPVVLYFFSGGMILGSVHTEKLIERWLAQEANAIVCAVGYRLLPLHPYPTPIQDSVEGSLAILTNQASAIEEALQARMDLERVATWGISAGGYMSSHVARRLTEKGYRLRCQVAMVPMVQPASRITASMLRYWKNPFTVWTVYMNAYAWSAFLRNDHGLAGDWKVNLLVDPPDEVLPHLPPAYLQINTKDILRDEGELYAERLQSQGKLIAVDEFATGHIGTVPGLARGGPGDGAILKALQVLKQHIHE